MIVILVIQLFIVGLTWTKDWGLKNIKLIHDLDNQDISLAGGKAPNLGKLARAGFRVPPGFCILTTAYLTFIRNYSLEEKILKIIGACLPQDPADLEALSLQIRDQFEDFPIPEDISASILSAYRSMGSPAVAVRSSATAEDLPDMSFAGQQDTYLNITNEKTLLEAVVHCWASLWSGRAIGYRNNHQVKNDQLAIAVIVQQMIHSQSSGVMFTANPLTGCRNEIVIDAVLGLGEALVSGKVEPDQYIVDLMVQKIKKKTIGAKMHATRYKESGGVSLLNENNSSVQALPDPVILELADLGSRVQNTFKAPQDIEWAWYEDKLYLLQSRPVTSLYPLPDNCQPDPLQIFLSFGSFQGLLTPITPIGQSALQSVFADGASLFGLDLDPQTQTVLLSAGERLWINFTPIFRNPLGRRILPRILGAVDPGVVRIVTSLVSEKRLQPGKTMLSFSAFKQMLPVIFTLGSNLIRNLAAPEPRRKEIQDFAESILKQTHSQLLSISGDPYECLTQWTQIIGDQTYSQGPVLLPKFVAGIASAMIPFMILSNLIKKLKGTNLTEDLVMEMTRSIPGNPTTEMDLALWKVSRVIKQDPVSLAVFEQKDPDELTALYNLKELPQAASKALSEFLTVYGKRGLGEIDMGRIRWEQDPTHLFQVMRSYLSMEEDDKSPLAVFNRGKVSAENAIKQLEAVVINQRFGRLLIHPVRALIYRMRIMMAIREFPKFFVVRLLGDFQKSLLGIGSSLTELGVINQASDILFLTMTELKLMGREKGKDWKPLFEKRRKVYDNEMKRRQVPRLMLSDGTAFYEGIVITGNNPGGTLAGSPVSPGAIRGKVHVVFDPTRESLAPGEILVCLGTDPSWTPLFLAAGGLITEVGGLMTHGAVVAREYGIPAVVGVHQATTLLQTGQMIQLDGSSGQISILDNIP